MASVCPRVAVDVAKGAGFAVGRAGAGAGARRVGLAIGHGVVGSGRIILERFPRAEVARYRARQCGREEAKMAAMHARGWWKMASGVFAQCWL